VLKCDFCDRKATSRVLERGLFCSDCYAAVRHTMELGKGDHRIIDPSQAMQALCRKLKWDQARVFEFTGAQP
jgi:hypothetical protein